MTADAFRRAMRLTSSLETRARDDFAGVEKFEQKETEATKEVGDLLLCFLYSSCSTYVRGPMAAGCEKCRRRIAEK
jgi:hypothetical protein